MKTGQEKEQEKLQNKVGREGRKDRRNHLSRNDDGGAKGQRRDKKRVGGRQRREKEVK